MAEPESPVETFKRATAATLRAVAESDQIEVTFGAEGASLAGKRARLSVPARALPAEDVTRIRGESDALAVRVRYHDAMVHARRQPSTPTGRAIYEALEQTRCEALGGRRMVGLAHNLDAMLEQKYRRFGYDKVLEMSDTSLPEVVRCLAREAMTGEPPPPAIRALVDLWRPTLEPKIGEDLRDLSDTAENQERFSRTVRQILADLNLEAAEEEDGDQQDDQENGDQDQGQQGETRGESGEQQSEEEQTGQQETRPDPRPGAESDGSTEDTDADMMMGEAEERPGEAPPRQPREVPQTAAEPLYRPYTAAFDETIDAVDLCDPEELTRLRLLLDQQLQHLQGVIGRLANRLQRRLMAKQLRSWQFDLEEGLLDAGRLARVVVSPTVPLSYKQENDTNFRDTVVTLLIDNSGSMRGRPITIAAMSADILARTLERCGVKVEINRKSVV